MNNIKTRDSTLQANAPKVKNITARTRQVVEKAADIANPYKEDGSATSYAERQSGEAAKRIGRSAKNTAVRGARLARKHTPIKTAQRSIKNTKQSVKNVQRTVKQAQRTVKTAKKTAEAAAKTAKATAKAAKAMAQAAKAAAKTAVAAAKAAVKVTVAAIKAIIAAVKSLIAIIAAGGWVAVVVILVICMIAFLLASPYGIFYSSESFAGSKTMQEVVSELNTEFYDTIKAIENSVSHDVLEYEASDGLIAVDWIAALSVYAVKVSGIDDSQHEVATVDDEKMEMIRQIMWDMNAVTYSTHQCVVEREEIYYDARGNKQTRTVYETETVLTIHIEHKSESDIAAFYNFTDQQYDFLSELMSPEYAAMWASIVGVYRDANGQILNPDATWIGIGIFSWPMQAGYSITSLFGWRTLDGKPNYHGGLDIGAPEGTPILAAAGGTVTVANATDSWGGGYGYYVLIHHNNTYDTVYAHCSAIAVYYGQEVVQGQVIGYVGNTGNSRGNHLHFEVFQNGTKVDPLLFFRPA